MYSNKLKEELRTTPLIVTFLLTFVLLAIVQVVVDTPMMIAERFVPGAGWIEALLLAAYASWLLRRLNDWRGTAIWRRRLWTFFSVVFFAQLAIGLLGAERFLMSGDLHLPIPAMIIAGPLYRGAASSCRSYFSSRCYWLARLGAATSATLAHGT